ncbi:hypothetical protein PHMEG_00013973 [Phytophthora megakarya]|uniref:Uncharacterized protein n=1 Tax=Phytophthora megakarya TaxID=4795 RepID=A0A225W6H8_9STRA|nr:hypothetical protein PHMEG_00013973 [Phytophthora megakarya]
MSRAARNKRLKCAKKSEDDPQFVPEGINPYQRTYICTHGWKNLRGVEYTRVRAEVKSILVVGIKRSRIYDYLMSHDQKVVQIDVNNMVRAHSSSLFGGDDNEDTRFSEVLLVN